MYRISDETNPAHPAHSNHLISTKGRKAERVWFPESPLLESVQHELINICNDHMRERCGFVTDEWEVVEVENSHEEPHRNFYMDDDDAKDALHYIYEKRKDSVIAIWHTHPNDVVWPSPRDLRGWPNPNLGRRYFIVTNKEVVEWELSD